MVKTDAQRALVKLYAKAYMYAPTNTHEEAETIRQALEQPPVDVESLKKDIHEPVGRLTVGFDSGEKIGKIKGWNSCINHLASRGYLRQPIDWENIERAVFMNAEAGLDISPEAATYAVNYIKTKIEGQT